MLGLWNPAVAISLRHIRGVWCVSVELLVLRVGRWTETDMFLLRARTHRLARPERTKKYAVT